MASNFFDMNYGNSFNLLYCIAISRRVHSFVKYEQRANVEMGSKNGQFVAAAHYCCVIKERGFGRPKINVVVVI